MKEIKLNKGYVALVDDEDYERLAGLNWRVSLHKSKKNVYAIAVVKMHRVVLNVKDSNVTVDHKNHNGLDCRRENLRICTRSQNHANRKRHKMGSSKYKGVQFHKASGRWMSRISRLGKVIANYHATQLEAAVDYDVMSRAMDGEFSCPNFNLCPIVFTAPSFEYKRFS